MPSGSRELAPSGSPDLAPSGSRELPRPGPALCPASCRASSPALCPASCRASSPAAHPAYVLLLPIPRTSSSKLAVDVFAGWVFTEAPWTRPVLKPGLGGAPTTCRSSPSSPTTADAVDRVHIKVCFKGIGRASVGWLTCALVEDFGHEGKQQGGGGLRGDAQPQLCLHCQGQVVCQEYGPWLWSLSTATSESPIRTDVELAET